MLRGTPRHEVQPMLELELGEDEKQGHCQCCGSTSSAGHGFVYRDQLPHAVYYAAWSMGHREHGVALAVAIGRWEEGTTAADRTSFGIEVYEGENHVLFRFVDPEDSPWANSPLLGPVLARTAALMSPRSAEALAIAEIIAINHPGIRHFLGMSNDEHDPGHER